MWLDYGEPVEPLGILVDYWTPIPPVRPKQEPEQDPAPPKEDDNAKMQ